MDPEVRSWIWEFVLRQYIRKDITDRFLAMLPGEPADSESDTSSRVRRAIIQRLLVEGLTRRLIAPVTLDNIEAFHALRPLPGAADAYCTVAVHLAASAADLPSAVADLWGRRLANLLLSPSTAGLASPRLMSEARDLGCAISDSNLRTRILGRYTKNQALDAVRALLEADFQDMGPPILELVGETVHGDEAEVPSGLRAEATATHMPSRVAQQQAMPVVSQQQAMPVVSQQQATSRVAQQQATPRAAQQEATPRVAQQQATPVVAQQQATLRVAQQQATPVVTQQQRTQTPPIVAQQQRTQTLPIVAQQQRTQTPPIDAQQQRTQTLPVVAQQQRTQTPPIFARQTMQIPPVVSQQQMTDIPPRVARQQTTQTPTGVKATQMPPRGGETHMPPRGKEMPRQSEIDGGQLGMGTTPTMNEEGNSDKAMERDPAAGMYKRDSSLKGKAVCPPTLVENKRRKTRRWSVLEEDTLRNAVRELGKGYWKEILRSYSDVFEGRTEVDLKDKWRNMTR